MCLPRLACVFFFYTHLYLECIEGKDQLALGREGSDYPTNPVEQNTLNLDANLKYFKHTCIPRRICLIVIEGFQSSSSFKIERHTVPLG